MNIRKIIAQEMTMGEGNVRVEKMPEDKKASSASFKKLEVEINAQIQANAAVCSRSMRFASKSSLR